MDDLVQEFVAETVENLSVLDTELVRFEQNAADQELLGNIFRVMHTIKGTCGFLGLSRLERVAHAGEDVLGRFRDGTLAPTPEAVTLILRCFDQIRAIVVSLSRDGSEGSGSDESLIESLRAMADGRAPATAVPPPAKAEPARVESVKAAPVKPEPAKPAAVEEKPAAVAAVPPAPPREEAKPEPKPEPEQSRERAATQTIRVNVEVLENLMTLVSEMVLTRNQLLQLTRSDEGSVFKEPIQRLSRTTTELQEGVMKTRMQPIGNAWSKLPRLVRDLANDLGKKINLEMHGEDTELDRQVLELIQDPLTHMVRNSADHGLEGPEDRLAAGKTENGTIRLSASHEGGHIIIQIADDGRGLNTAKIRTKVIERGLATADEVAAMDDAQVNQFIMKPGFSTADAVTKVSGRGVGMDVVRSNIEKIGGTIEFVSVYGKGSTFTIKIPLTLAIISSLVVECADQRFALPQIAVNEVVRISERSEYKIESLKGAPVLRLRENILPLVNLSEVLDLAGETRGWTPGANTFDGYVVVCRNGSQVLGLIVDAIADSEEIVVKPLSPILGSTKHFSGNTILGDGRVILILDVNGLASCLNQSAVQAQRAEEKPVAATASGESILLFKTMGEGTKAVALSKVHRIESFDMGESEVTQGELVIQYRDRLLPLASLDGADGIRREGRQTVLVFGTGAAAIGLAIESILDIAQDALVLQKPARMPGLLGSGIVAGRAVDILDAEYFVGPGAIEEESGVMGEAA
jgi:two-component system chemotaxis sensor kinase CheA